MALIDETSVINSNLAGLRTLSDDQTIPFTLYVRWVLPADGYVFWLGTGSTFPARGSIHVSIDKKQNEDETVAVNRIVLTTGKEVQQFNKIDPDQMWVGEFAGVRFSFSHSGPRYRAAGLYHYDGVAVYPALANMLVPVGQQLPKSTQVVSNSLPMWFALATYAPIWLYPPNPKVALYPSFAIPDNLVPPYGAVHVASTRELQATPRLGPTSPVGRAALGTATGTTLDSTHWQLVADRVRVTLYGLTNATALAWLDLVNNYSYDQDLLGVMSCEAVYDEKRAQPELGILAMKKTIEYEVSYYQANADATARQLIDSAVIASMNISSLPPII